MLPNLITLTLKVTFSDFWRYLALGLIAIYMFLPMQATPLVFACIVSGVTVGQPKTMRTWELSSASTRVHAGPCSTTERMPGE